MTPYGYIYRTYNTVTDTYYVGQHRGAFNTKYLGSGVVLLKAMKKHGKAAFTVELLEYAGDEGELNLLEIDYIAAHRDLGVRLYNLSEGGYAGPGFWPTGPDHQSFGKKRTEEVRLRMSKAAKARGFISESISPEALTKRSGVNHWTQKMGGFSLEHRRKLSLSHLGKPSSKKGKKVSEETRTKLRQAWLTRPPITEETKRKLSLAVKLSWIRRKDLVLEHQN